MASKSLNSFFCRGCDLFVAQGGSGHHALGDSTEALQYQNNIVRFSCLGSTHCRIAYRLFVLWMRVGLGRS